MKKKSAKTKKRTSVVRKSSVTRSVPTNFWGNDRSMVVLLAAGVIVMAVAGMYIAGWL